MERSCQIRAGDCLGLQMTLQQDGAGWKFYILSSDSGQASITSGAQDFFLDHTNLVGQIEDVLQLWHKRQQRGGMCPPILINWPAKGDHVVD